MICEMILSMGAKEVIAQSHDMWEARRLGREVARRMLTLLSQLAEQIKIGALAYVPTREEVLGVLDVESNSRQKHADLLKVFPKMSS